MNADDILLIKRCLDGADEAFGWLFQKYQGLVYHWAWQRLGNHADAQDVTQEVFSRIYANLSKLSDFTKFRSWLYRIVVNCCNDWFRERRHSLAYQLYLEDDADIDYIKEAWMRAGESEARLMVRDAVECLDEAHKQTVRMYYWEGYTCREISKILGVSIGTVTSRLTRARKQLRKELGWMTSKGKKTQEIITGYLLGPDGRPIVFADVALGEFGVGDKKVKEVKTMGDGKFIFQGKFSQHPKLVVIPQVPDTFTMANFNIVKDNFEPITVYAHRPLKDIGKRYIAGRILEENGITPLRNAEFTMSYYCPTSNARPGGSETNITLATDENGRYRHQLSHSVCHSESFCFIILHNGRLAKRIVKIPTDSSIDDLDFALKPRRLLIRGRCINAVDGSIEEDVELKGDQIRWFSKTLVKDIPIYIIGGEYNISQQSLTNDEGYFEFYDLPPGMYRLSTDPWGMYASTRVRITEENMPVYAEVLRVPYARASGMVTSSKDGTPINYAEVRWSGNIWRTYDGRYSNLIVGPGHAEIYASARGHKTVKRKIVAMPGQNFENLDFVLPYEGYTSATGTVDVGAVSGKVTQIDGSLPPPDTIVIFTPHLSARYTEHDKTQVATCDEHGKFHVTHLSTGDYVMVAVAKGFPMTFRFVHVDAAQTLDGLDLQLQSGGTVEGKFIVPDGNSIPQELRVILVPQPTVEHEKLPHWVPLKKRTWPIVDIVEGQFSSGTSFFQVRADPVNQYINEYCAEIFSLEREGSTVAAYFRIEQILPGKYDVAVQALNHRIEIPIQTIEIKPNEITQLELIMPRYGSLNGRVLDAQTRKPIECAEISVESEHQLQTPGVYTDADGNYHVDMLLTGKFRIRASSHNRLPYMVENVDVREGEMTEVADIELLEGGYIDGIVNESETFLSSDGKLSIVLEKDGEELKRKEVSWDGKFFFDNLQPGQYAFKLIDDSESDISEQQVEIVSGGEVTVAFG